ncbi:Receptor-type guanylate cyclase gcy [Seminavis robusta]|uniref:Receptor-type guanylate cyclase gcy n=1 Tax=Seminavis robusta TaxID=568900 RepID=A0A9N8H1Z1_9STRA|nr:Receptor-type guanylate cyclase gcy [Seminavis robusta]|eukprot:Sro53_g031340.1 Receptor-type guanylate cyclase gcy (1983) ;mRNA; f:41479-48630
MGRKRSLRGPQPQQGQGQGPPPTASSSAALRQNRLNLSSIQLLHLDEDQDECSDIGDLSVSTHASGIGLDTSNANNDRGIAGIDDLYHQDSESQSPSDDCSVGTAHSSVKVKRIAKRETRKVTRWKTLVMTLLLINAGLVTISTFDFMRRQEEDEFQAAFYRAAKTVSDASHYHAHGLVDALRTFGDTTTSYALDTNVQWPRITMPHFERRAAAMRHNSFLNMFAVVPIVHAKDRADWEEYTEYTQSWIQNSYDLVKSTEDPGQHASSRTTVTHGQDQQEQLLHVDLVDQDDDQDIHHQRDAIHIPTSIHNPMRATQFGVDIPADLAPTNSTGPYAPLWQISPPPLPTAIHGINSDLLAIQPLADLVLAMHQSRFIAVSMARSMDLFDGDMVFEYYTNRNRRHRHRHRRLGADHNHNHDNGQGHEHLEDQTEQKQTNSNTTSLFPSPNSIIVYPIYDSFDRLNRRIKAFMMGVMPWDRYFSDLLPAEVYGIVGIVQNTCGQSFTFSIDGPKATFRGEGDLHDRRFDGMMVETAFEEFRSIRGWANESGNNLVGHCDYKFTIYPTAEFRDIYTSSRPEYFALGLTALFAFTGMVFLVYVYASRRRQRKVMAVALSTSAIVASMFPSNVRDRILQDAEEEAIRKIEEDRQERLGTERVSETNRNSSSDLVTPSDDHPESENNPRLRNSVRSSVMSSLRSSNRSRSRPIADLFPDVTIMFADIVGFSAWSNVREPHQVFALLETIYHAFDSIARRRRVYKVETIGDCYVACAGLPTPRGDHAVLMARYARDCLEALGSLTKQLERSLGPDTGELTMRFGLHSGPCTAGVLRAERARYQIFGDAVNVAARMESTCEPGQIQLSQDTAELLAAAKKSSWFIPRDQLIEAKSIGCKIQTYWLHPKRDEQEVKSEGHSSDTDSVTHHWLEVPSNLARGSDTLRAHLSDQNQRLAEWNSNQLLTLLNQVVKQRNARVAREGNDSAIEEACVENIHLRWNVDSVAIIDEVKDVIPLPSFDPALLPNELDNKMTDLPEIAIQQLHDFVSIICSMYKKDLPNNNYQKASHVTMGVVKLLSRIVSNPRNDNRGVGAKPSEKLEDAPTPEMLLYEKSLGIAADPMSQFALAFAALIADVDHPGVTNDQLVCEGSRLARIYNHVSIAEQNSFTTAWDLLMDPMFGELRSTIYSTREEFEHFRQVLVNAVMATDMNNVGVNEARVLRWEKAFYKESNKDKVDELPSEDATNLSASTNSFKKKFNLDRKATAMMESIMQASSISSNMQHWHVFRKWNEREFQEASRAFQQGRGGQNPSETWYQAQLDFFDNIAIPLAKRLKESGVFGSYSDEYLNHAKRNREEWFRKGTTIVQSMEKAFAQKHNDKTPRTPSRSKMQAKEGVSSEPPVSRLVGLGRSRSQDSVVPNWDDINDIRRRQSMDGAPRAPRRPSIGEVSGTVVGLRRTRSQDSIVPIWDDINHIRRRPSMDGAPKAPRRPSLDEVSASGLFFDCPDLKRGESECACTRRSQTDDAPYYPLRSLDLLGLEEPARAVQELFDSMPPLKRKPSSDDIPQHPRRSRDSISLADDARAAAGLVALDEQRQAKSVDETPRTPKRSHDSQELALIVEQIFDAPNRSNSLPTNPKNANRPSQTSDPSIAFTMDTSHTTQMSTSHNSHSIDTVPTSSAPSKSDMSPKTPIRRRAVDDDATVATMEQIPEQTAAELQLPIMGNTTTTADSTASISEASSDSHLDEDEDHLPDDEDDTIDDSSVSDNDESTLLTMGNLWTSRHQTDNASHFDDSTIFTRDQRHYSDFFASHGDLESQCDDSTIFTRSQRHHHEVASFFDDSTIVTRSQRHQHDLASFDDDFSEAGVRDTESADQYSTIHTRERSLLGDLASQSDNSTIFTREQRQNHEGASHFDDSTIMTRDHPFLGGPYDQFDDCTILTKEQQQHNDCASQNDDSTILTREQQSLGPTASGPSRHENNSKGAMLGATAATGS